MNEKPSQLYREAIEALQALSADFGTSEAARGAANAQIAALRPKLQEAALDDMTARTANLKALSARLSGVLGAAQGPGGARLQALAQKLRGAIGV